MNNDRSLLAARDVEVSLARRRRFAGGAARPILKGVSLDLRPGRVVGLVGPSGAGKSTLVRTLVGLVIPSGGDVLFEGIPLSSLDRAGRQRWRREVQLVFQDPWGSLNPRLRVARVVAEPLAIRGDMTVLERNRRVQEAVESVGLAPASEYLDRWPDQLSGGQRQRVALARSLVGEPSLLILDEPVSALDALIRLEILATLASLRHRHNIGMLLVAHDVSMVGGFCDHLVVMAGGKVVEEGRPETVIASPVHTVTRELVAATRELASHVRGAPGAGGGGQGSCSPMDGRRNPAAAGNVVPGEHAPSGRVGAVRRSSSAHENE